jgi:acyl-coenzyme A thioesterase PaaI-like protein
MSDNKPNKVMALYNKVTRLPFGKRIFSLMVSRMAPYFATVKPLVTDLSLNRCELMIKKRKRVQNHIGTVHVIAICNGLEMAMGAMAEASIPKHLRWIPKGMSVDYTAKAGSDIRCVAQVTPEQWQEGDMLVDVKAYDSNNVAVVQGTIKLWISLKPIK